MQETHESMTIEAGPMQRAIRSLLNALQASTGKGCQGEMLSPTQKLRLVCRCLAQRGRDEQGASIALEVCQQQGIHQKIHQFLPLWVLANLEHHCDGSF